MMNQFKRFGCLLVALTVILGVCLVQMPVAAEDSVSSSIVYQVEDYYSGNISEGVAADMQPNQTIDIALSSNSSFVDGRYLLTVRSCGNRTSFEIKVNGESVGTISRAGTDFGKNQMTNDKLYAVLTLKADDVVTIVAPGEGYGWVDTMQLDAVCGNVAVYQAESYYSGNISDGIAADMQPNEKIEIALNSNSGFVAGKYALTIRSCGNRESFDILVNGESVGNIGRSGTGYGKNEMTDDKLSVELTLKPEDVITIVAPDGSYWGWVDFLLLTGVHSFTDKASSSQATAATATEAATYYVQCDNCDKIHDSLTVAVGEPDNSQTPGDPDDDQEATEDKAETEEPGDEIDYDYIIYQCENHYGGNISEGVAADLQPGEHLDVQLGSDAAFKAGKYTLTIYSCGNRESFDILVNGEKVGAVTRTGTGFGQDQMTYDKLSVVLELKPEDTLTLVGQSGEYWGWVDFIVLDVVREAPETGDDVNPLIPVILALSVSALAVLAVNKRLFLA